MTWSPLGPVVALLFLTFASPAPQVTTVTPTRDPQAVAILQQAITAMGTMPADSTATGTVAITEGSTSQTGTIQILTLGTNSTSETVTLPDDQRIIVYSNGNAKETRGSQSLVEPLEISLADQSADFPLPFISSILANGDESIHYVGQETLTGESVQHIHAWNTFASQPAILQTLAALSTCDIWFDYNSGLPVKIAYSRQATVTAAATIPVTLLFASYQTVNGVLYPFQITKSFNGTPWQTITIQSVVFDSGLTAAQFQTK